ncbi:MAG: NUDIX hydrolase [Candidatus Omnitrophica bacterium]|jgi:ADP-ribose pyrophosphatase|nr:NUDIX hydrolase [Candidatus Omnitrophota bacterium]
MKFEHKNFKGKILNVSVKKIRLPNGYLARFEIVKHPGAVLVVPLLGKNKVIMLRQLRPVINSYIYELPAGTLEKGERPEACARREIVEETGYKSNKFIKLGLIFPVPGYSTEKIFIYKAQNLVKTKPLHQKDEVIETFVFTKREIQKMFKEGKIIDAKTICGFALCGWLKEAS